MFFSFAAAAGGGRAIAVKPTLTHHTSTGQFRITNYDAAFTYNLSVNAGTATRSSDIITLSAADSVCTVTARLPKSVSDSTAATAERKEYDATQGAADVSFIHAPPEHGISIPNVIGARWLYCTQFAPPLEGECGHQEGTMVKAGTPAGYTDSYGEWWRVS